MACIVMAYIVMAYIDCGAKIDGGGWTLVRHVPAGNTWHKATDQLRGTDVYGSAAAGATGSSEWVL